MMRSTLGATLLLSTLVLFPAIAQQPQSTPAPQQATAEEKAKQYTELMNWARKMVTKQEEAGQQLDSLQRLELGQKYITGWGQKNPGFKELTDFCLAELQGKASELSNSVQTAKTASCTLTVFDRAKPKDALVPVALNPADALKNGGFRLYDDQDGGAFAIATLANFAAAAKAPAKVEVVFFPTPERKSGIVLKGTEMLANSDKTKPAIPVHFEGQAVAPSLQGLSVIVPGPGHVYTVDCK